MNDGGNKLMMKSVLVLLLIACLFVGCSGSASEKTVTTIATTTVTACDSVYERVNIPGYNNVTWQFHFCDGYTNDTDVRINVEIRNDGTGEHIYSLGWQNPETCEWMDVGAVFVNQSEVGLISFTGTVKLAGNPNNIEYPGTLDVRIQQSGCGCEYENFSVIIAVLTKV